MKVHDSAKIFPQHIYPLKWFQVILLPPADH